MNKRLRTIAASLALAIAATVGIVTAHAAAAPPDTTWGAPATVDDTTWGTPPTGGGNGPSMPVRAPRDTTWG